VANGDITAQPASHVTVVAPGAVTELQMQQALEARESAAREREGDVADIFQATISEAKSDLRRDIKLYCLLGVMGGNAIAAVISAKLGPGPADTVRTTLSGARLLLGL